MRLVCGVLGRRCGEVVLLGLAVVGVGGHGLVGVVRAGVGVVAGVLGVGGLCVL